METRAAKIRVLIVDDHPVVRVGLKTMLESEGQIEVTGMASTAQEAIEEMDRRLPEVVLMDLRMPGTQGAESITLLRQLYREARILVLTNYESDEDILRALQAGAVGYLLKSMPQNEIMHAVELAQQNKRYIPPRIAQKLSIAVTYDELSQREIEVLGLVALGFTNKEIAEKLFISDKTARNHVANCLLKLGATDRTGAVTTALSRGLLRLAE